MSQLKSSTSDSSPSVGTSFTSASSSSSSTRTSSSSDVGCEYSYQRASVTSTSSSSSSSSSSSCSEEEFDVLTNDGELTGTRKARSAVHRDGDWHRSVHIWLVDIKTGQILIQQRATCKDSYPGLWDVSCAGHLSAGETSLRAAVCELHEELGIDVPKDTQPEQFIQFICTLKRQQISNKGRFIDNEWTDVYVVWGSYDAARLSLQASEVAQVRYIELDTYIQQLKQQSPMYVPFADLDRYIIDVFNVIQQQYKARYGQKHQLKHQNT